MLAGLDPQCAFLLLLLQRAVGMKFFLGMGMQA